ncbi:hypothetical protein D3C83_45370 [compost metagenome]
MRLELFDGVADAHQVVVHAEHAHRLARLAQRLDDVVLHLPFRLEDVDTCRVLGGHEMVVDEREYPDLLHRPIAGPACATDPARARPQLFVRILRLSSLRRRTYRNSRWPPLWR